MLEAVKANVSAAAAHNIARWLTEPKYAEYKQELESMIEAARWKDLEDAFYTQTEFGTAGIRGVTGIGSSRVSRLTIAEATQGLCEYVSGLSADAKQKGIVIACDTRLTSPEFSRYSAEVCAGNGMKTYVFEQYRSTPELSFAVRHLGCAAGIVISASHNPPADNGFKAYLSDGGQLVAPHDKGVVARASAVDHINIVEFDTAVEKGSIILLGSDIDDAYIQAVANESLGRSRSATIVYSPLHGTGQTNTLPVLERAGFKDIITVPEQMIPDGNFPTIDTRKPNPEEKPANDMAVAIMLAHAADIAITNDPDADRFGVMVRNGDQPIYLSGNQSLALATEFCLSKLKDAGELTSSHFIVKTIVTTALLDAIANRYSIKTYGNLLIGFKYVSELLLAKQSTKETFVIAGEESFGLLKGDASRDKDGAVGALLLAEYASELKDQNKTLYDRLLEIYDEYGVFVERLDTIVCPGASGFEQMTRIMKRLRDSPPEMVAHEKVTAVIDYEAGTSRNTTTGAISKIDVPKGNVVTLIFGDSARGLTIRPSGTEPKIKVYGKWMEPSGGHEGIENQIQAVEHKLEGLGRELEGLALEA